MALINVAAREIHGKIVYYGPGLCGKTTNLQYIHGKIPTETKGDLLSIATETERTLFFDFLPLDLGKVHGFTIRFHLYTVPGQVLYERTRIAVLNGADGVVFVADAQRDRLQDNLQSLRELAKQRQRAGASGFSISRGDAIQQDGSAERAADAGAGPVSNTIRVPRFEATAVNGGGVFETLRAICKLVTNKL